MASRVIATSNGCADGDCPTFLASGPDVLVQGHIVDVDATELPAGYTIRAGETLVRIPAADLDRLVQNYLTNGPKPTVRP